MEARKQAIIDALDRWIRQRPGLDYGNYGDISSYRAEVRSIGRDLQHARTLLDAVRWRDSIDADRLLIAFRDAYSGRLSCALTGNDREGYSATLDYCTGQYWPTEYRRAACAVLASALWDWTRDCAMPSDEQLGKQPMGSWLREHFQREFGRSIARRWFN